MTNKDEPFTHCAICNKQIDCYELCAECAVGNDPFETSKYSEPARAEATR